MVLNRRQLRIHIHSKNAFIFIIGNKDLIENLSWKYTLTNRRLKNYIGSLTTLGKPYSYQLTITYIKERIKIVGAFLEKGCNFSIKITYSSTSFLSLHDLHAPAWYQPYMGATRMVPKLSLISHIHSSLKCPSCCHL